MKGLRSIFSRKQVCMPLTNIQGEHVRKYRAFKSFLNHNHTALKAIAEMEQTYYSGKPFIPVAVKVKYEELLESAFGVIHSLERLSGESYPRLADVLHAIDSDLSDDLNPSYRFISHDLVLPFERITPELKNMVGAKAAHLALIKNNLGLPVPHGFAVTAYAFERFMEENRLWRPIERELSKLVPDSVRNIETVSKNIQAMIGNADIPMDLREAIMSAYAALEEKAGKNVSIAMRSSAIGEDTEATFAGQYTTVLNVMKGNLIDAYKTVIASKYSARAISYRMHYGLDDRETPMCVAGIVMVDARSSGVIYTESSPYNNKEVIRVNSIWGLGEHLVDGSASPDTFLVAKKDSAIIAQEISRKDYRIVRSGPSGTVLEEVPWHERERPSIDSADAAKLARCGLTLENYFGGPQDIEWALDSKGDLFILQSRPLMVSEPPRELQDIPQDFPNHPILLSGGKTASEGIAMGNVFVMKEGEDTAAIPENAILVAKTASPHYAKLAGKINGIITDIGSVTSHLSSVAREFGIPALVDTKNATDLLQNGEAITLSASTAKVYKGVVDALAQEIRLSRRVVFETPVHRRVRRVIDRISPLNLTDPEAPSFSPEGCRTVHDIIRLTHEYAMRAMFGLTEEAEELRSVRLVAPIPLVLHLIDLGEGLRKGLTTCDTITP
ncbi:MAG: PEP/pyruvate-binding domain-containing protein [Nitrospirota bacterium]